MSAASWLYDNDVTAARAMLAEATQAENEILKRNALKEIELLKRTIVSGQVKSAHYTVEMPSGKLFVNVFTPSLFSSVLKFFK
jgi:autonomous glycyl radical cofactor GrcA